MSKKFAVSLKDETVHVNVPDEFLEHFTAYGLRITLERATAGKGDGMTKEAREAIIGLVKRIENGTFTPGAGGGGKAPSIERHTFEVIRDAVRKIGNAAQKKAFDEINRKDAKAITQAIKFYVRITGGDPADGQRHDAALANATKAAEKRIAALKAAREQKVTL